MKISLNWLKKYIDFDFSVKEISERLTMVGLEVEKIDIIKPQFHGVVVGEIIKTNRHPNADKLTLCDVNIGEKVLHIICGAPNVKEGQIVAVAKVDARLGEEKPIKSVTIRGIQSEGMICSEKELGLSNNHSGILVLDKNNYSIGEIYLGSSQLEDHVLELNVTPNRPDCLSYIGVAREIGVMTSQTPILPESHVNETGSLIDKLTSVIIQDEAACPRYSARIIQDVIIDTSPHWLRTHLQNAGIRPINNIVDITNFIMMETGQPLHAFDYDLLKDRKIVVRKAMNGESFRTLDNDSHTLNSQDLLICDGEKGIALAGIMGGLNTEVTENTKNILLESAYFDSMTIRKTSKRLGMKSEASQRFERGTDPNNTIFAINRASKLISEITNGKVAQNVFDVYPTPICPWTISMRHSRTNHVLGTKISQSDITNILTNLGLSIKGTDTFNVTVPTFRPDLKQEIDLIEEVIRHYGYEKIIPQLLSNISLTVLENPEQELVEELRNIFTGLGFLEIMTNSLLSQNENLLVNPKIIPVKLQNPLSPDTAYLRTSLVPSLLNTIQWNNNRGINNLHIFEIGRIFNLNSKSNSHEYNCVSGALSGKLKFKSFWGEKNQKITFFHIKGIIETFLQRLHIGDITFKLQKYTSLIENSSLSILCKNQEIGFLGEIKNNILKEWDIENDVFVFEFSIQKLLDILPDKKQYRPVPRFPAVKRDLAIIVDESISVESLKNVIFKNGGSNLYSTELFDLYKGQQVPSGKKSVAFSLTFLSLKRTLQEKEVDPIMDSILNALDNSFSAKLR
jgi:phenylalanyl-tRNA synthetase beta chain